MRKHHELTGSKRAAEILEDAGPRPETRAPSGLRLLILGVQTTCGHLLAVLDHLLVLLGPCRVRDVYDVFSFVKTVKQSLS